MGEQYDVRDNWGRKVGTATRTGGGMGGGDGSCELVILSIFVVVAIIAGIIYGAVSLVQHTAHPMMPETTIAATAATASGAAIKNSDGTIQLNQGGSLTFTVNNPYRDDQFAFDSSWDWGYVGSSGYGDTSIFVNGTKLDEISTVTGHYRSGSYIVKLRKGQNIISIVNLGTRPTDVSSIYLKELDSSS